MNIGGFLVKNQNFEVSCEVLSEVELQEIVGGGVWNWLKSCFGKGTAPVNPVEPLPSAQGQVREAWYVPIRR